MADQPKSGISFDDWLGLLPNASPHRPKPGAAREQMNLRIHVPGQAEVRGGLKPVTFSNATTSTSHEVISMVGYHRPDAAWIVFEDSSGNVRAGKNPTIS